MTIAASGLAADAQWLDAIASNVANMNDQSALPSQGGSYSGYRPVNVQMSANVTGGVTAQIEPLTPSYSAVSDPSAPLANAQGLIAVPNVDLATAIVDQNLALASYRANADVFRTAMQMTKTLLDTVA